jgi:hypothetical protein
MKHAALHESDNLHMNQPYPPHPALPAALTEALAQRFADRFSISRAVRDQHGRDESVHPAAAPDAVVFAESHGGSRRGGEPLPGASGAGHPLWRGQFGRRDISSPSMAVSASI